MGATSSKIAYSAPYKCNPTSSVELKEKEPSAKVRCVVAARPRSRGAGGEKGGGAVASRRRRRSPRASSDRRQRHSSACAAGSRPCVVSGGLGGGARLLPGSERDGAAAPVLSRSRRLRGRGWGASSDVGAASAVASPEGRAAAGGGVLARGRCIGRNLIPGDGGALLTALKFSRVEN